MKELYLGIDVGSISTDFVLMLPDRSVYKKLYIRTHGNPVSAVIKGMTAFLYDERDISILGVGATGSGRQIAAEIVGADIVKNEITAHGVAAVQAVPEVKTVLEIGGQDSKIIFIENGIIVDFNMNTVCAAGTGSFLDRQAERLDIKIEQLGDLALSGGNDCQIAGRCAVFAESDMIHKQQEGYSRESILSGLCSALVRNYINNLCAGRKLNEPIVFQGGVAANKGIVKAFNDALNTQVIIPKYYDVMGAWGAAILAQENKRRSDSCSMFKGCFDVNGEWRSKSDICSGCANRCRVSVVYIGDRAIGRIGNRCENTTVKI